MADIFDKALTLNHRDVAGLALDTCFKIKEGYSILFNTNDQKVYSWNEKELLWTCVKEEYHLRRSCFDNIVNKCSEIMLNLISEANILEGDAKNELLLKIDRITRLISRLGTVSFKSSVWKELNEQVSTKSMNAVYELPLNDGSMFNIFTHERRTRTLNDHYTYTLNASITDSVKSVAPDETSTDTHKQIWSFLSFLMNGDEDMVLFLIKTLGIYIGGNMDDHSFLILTGKSEYNKEILLSWMKWILNFSCMRCPPELLFGPPYPGLASREFANVLTHRLIYSLAITPESPVSPEKIKIFMGETSCYSPKSACYLIIGFDDLPKFMDPNVKTSKCIRTINVNDKNFDDKSLIQSFQTPIYADTFLTMLAMGTYGGLPVIDEFIQSKEVCQ